MLVIFDKNVFKLTVCICIYVSSDVNKRICYGQTFHICGKWVKEKIDKSKNKKNKQNLRKKNKKYSITMANE